MGGAISDAFSHLPFDKIIFTGSTSVGKTVMAAAAENLVPVILELGGKSPAIIHPSMDMKDAAQRLAVGKLWNAGQTCVAPDYLFLPKGRAAEFIENFKTIVKGMYLIIMIIKTIRRLSMINSIIVCKTIWKMPALKVHESLKLIQNKNS
jgi:acyl-CoA reductase-like NAD-dependent aldehyde dehydrogenase